MRLGAPLPGCQRGEGTVRERTPPRPSGPCRPRPGDPGLRAGTDRGRPPGPPRDRSVPRRSGERVRSPGWWDPPNPGGAPLPPGPPAVAGTDIGLLLPGDAAVVDGSAGTVRLDEVTRVEVVTAFLQREDGRIL